MSDLDTLKVGDRVAMSQKYGGQTIRAVVRLTAKQVFVNSTNKAGELGFWKSSGNAIGSSGDKFGGDRIFIPSADAMVRLEQEVARRHAVHVLRKWDLTEVPTAILVRLADDAAAAGARAQ